MSTHTMHGSHARSAGEGHGERAGGAEHPAHEGHGAHVDHTANNGHEGHEGHGHEGHGHEGHGHEGHAHADVFRRRFWWSLLMTFPVVVTSHMVMDWFGYELDLPGMTWIGPVLGSIVFFWGGWPFLAGGASEAQAKRPGMMLLIAMAITVAYVASLSYSLGWFSQEFWWELAALITVMLLGHWQEMKALGSAQNALAALAALLPDEAERVLPNGTLETVPVARLSPGDVVLVRPGSRVPADGEIVEGAAEFDEAMITGESRPVLKTAGDRVTAGTVSTDSSVRMRVEAVGDDTALAGIQRLVAEAQRSKSRAQALADRAAARLFYVAVSAAAITMAAWTIAGDVDRAVLLTVGVLVISCPHALGLATPLVVSLSTVLAARNGILVKSRIALERMRTVDVVLFDKTGTLTKGRHVVVDAVIAAGEDAQAAWATAGAVEAQSEHPRARASTRAAATRGPLFEASAFRSMTGRGVEAVVGGRLHALGGPAMLRELELEEPAEIADAARRWRQRGATVLYLIRESSVIAAFALEDEVREEARQAVHDLKRMGRKVMLITGDATEVARAVAEDLGLDDVMAEVLPEEKDAKVAELQAQGLTVAMVGDGVNDAPALARADAGLAIGAGTDVAIESAGVILAGSDPRAVVAVIRLSSASYRKQLQNLVWAAGYNVVAIPLAAGALAWAGLTLQPAIGAVLMSLSTVVVALNAQLLRRLDLQAGPPVDQAAIS